MVTAPVVFYRKKPNKIYTRATSGTFSRLRIATIVITQLVFYGLPWLQWNGRQAVLFDLPDRKFYFFSQVFWPQDILLLALFLVFCAYSLFFITNVAGRVWCGYSCPQSVYSQMFIWIERMVEGSRSAQMALDKAPWGIKKIALLAAKHALWLLLAFITGFSFIGYFTPIAELIHDLAHFSLSAWQSFWLAFYSVATWGNAGFLREKVCLHMCPYARFQSAMFDKETLVVAYDKARGEPRGAEPRKRHAVAYSELRQNGLGDCIDCSMCVQVCPTGIDIRNGLQYQCIGCGACIDACDEVMKKISYPTGLIRYSSQAALAAGKTIRQRLGNIIRPQSVMYGGIWLIIFVVLCVFLLQRQTIKVNIEQPDRTHLYQELDDGAIQNQYNLSLINTTEKDVVLSLSVKGKTGVSLDSSPHVSLAPLESLKTDLIINWKMPADETAVTTPLQDNLHSETFYLTVKQGDEVVEVLELPFVVPY